MIGLALVLSMMPSISFLAPLRSSADTISKPRAAERTHRLEAAFTEAPRRLGVKSDMELGAMKASAEPAAARAAKIAYLEEAIACGILRSPDESNPF